ncbi:uncharacterized protein BO97DRAFT_265516 [Aspergillus homomorphus CBS 101889]|uniref:Uncharacterized protein n=1 Tax=Aspergillus homomorphus (strain CBS 101889) TaxID=1450537 RepID=A0A395HI49_ASPHC|nr:hypothetical protein BO97DRAFT_265516 [Aspergillus homomorphus CBS 101889]RAL07169.1 hypothetical protein BO97DRAFT_265516 [Aspergillus homomorphus CBS 101889]
MSPSASQRFRAPIPTSIAIHILLNNSSSQPSFHSRSFNPSNQAKSKPHIHETHPSKANTHQPRAHIANSIPPKYANPARYIPSTGKIRCQRVSGCLSTVLLPPQPTTPKCGEIFNNGPSPEWFIHTPEANVVNSSVNASTCSQK